MRICMFTNTYLPHVGGVARSVSFFAHDLREAGHRVLVIAPTFPACEAHDRHEPDLLRVPAIQNFNGSDFSVRIPSPFLVDEQVDRFEPHVIHSHHPYLLGDAALRTARRRQLPLIFTHHTLYEEYTHYITDNPENMKRFAAFLSINYANLCDRVVVPSESIQTLIHKRGVTVPTAVIPTGVDVAGFSKGDGRSFRQRHAIPQDAFVIGHLGRLAPEKNLAYLATAVARTLKKNRNACFLVVGDGPSRQAIDQIFVESGQHERLVLPGKATGQTLVDAYHAMDLLVFASHTETQGMVLIESMAAGVPVLALDAPGVREVVDNGVNGCLLDGDASSDQFADVLHWVVDAPEQLMAWSQAARRTASVFGRDRSAEQMLRLYVDAVSNKMEKGNFNDSDLDVWNKFLLACKAEWDLVANKTESMMQTVSDNEKVIGLDETA